MTYDKPSATAILVGACVAAVLFTAVSLPLSAEQPDSSGVAEDRNSDPANLLSPEEWQRLGETVDRALGFLAKHQHPDGSFESPAYGQPGVTSLCVMAFLSRGHLPGQGPHGEKLNRAVDFVLQSQRADGLISYVHSRPSRQVNNAGHHPYMAALYNHGISGLMLSEVYGMSGLGEQERIRQSILKAIKFTRDNQLSYNRRPDEQGGWRYLGRHRRNNSDVSVTSWQLMFLRSARNAEFDVPEKYVDEATAFIKRCFNDDEGAFEYHRPNGSNRSYVSAGVVGGGIVSLSLGGEHQSEIAQRAGRWILTENSFDDYNRRPHRFDRYHYSAFYCSQATFQLGGEYWHTFYPRLMRTLVAHQRSDGSWEPEATKDTHYGNIYTTAITVLALTPPYQLLPIYQR